MGYGPLLSRIIHFPKYVPYRTTVQDGQVPHCGTRLVVWHSQAVDKTPKKEEDMSHARSPA